MSAGEGIDLPSLNLQSSKAGTGIGRRRPSASRLPPGSGSRMRPGHRRRKSGTSVDFSLSDGLTEYDHRLKVTQRLYDISHQFALN